MTSKQFLIIIILTFITVVVWTVLDIIHSQAQIHPPAEIQQLLTPVDPNFDQSTINSL